MSANKKPKKTYTRSKATVTKTPSITKPFVDSESEQSSAKIVAPVAKVFSQGMVKKPELVERVVEKTGLKKQDVKHVLEGVLEGVLDALEREEDLNLPPLGKVKLVKSKTSSDGAVVRTLRLRSKAAKTDS